MEEIFIGDKDYYEINEEKTMGFFCLLKNNKQNESLIKVRDKAYEFKLNNYLIKIIDSHIAGYDEYKNKKIIDKCFTMSKGNLPFQRNGIMNSDKYSYYFFILPK